MNSLSLSNVSNHRGSNQIQHFPREKMQLQPPKQSHIKTQHQDPDTERQFTLCVKHLPLSPLASPYIGNMCLDLEILPGIIFPDVSRLQTNVGILLGDGCSGSFLHTVVLLWHSGVEGAGGRGPLPYPPPPTCVSLSFSLSLSLPPSLSPPHSAQWEESKSGLSFCAFITQVVRLHPACLCVCPGPG